MLRNDQNQFKNFSHKPLVGALLALFLIIPTVVESAEPAPANDMCRPCDAAAHAASHKQVRAKHHRQHAASGSTRKCYLKPHYKNKLSASARAQAQQASATARAQSRATAPQRLVLVPPCQTVSSKPIYMELQSPPPSATASANATATANAYAAATAYTPASTSTNTSNTSTYTYAPTTIHHHDAAASAPASAYKSEPITSTAGGSFLSKLRARSRFIIQAGLYNSTLGRTQDIYVTTIHDIYTVTQHNYQNGLVGLGYYIDGFDWSRMDLWYGINAFYFAPTMVKGDVIQEALYPNLSYRYSIIQFPIYLGLKGIVKTRSPNYDITLDAGVGPSIVKASNVQEYPRNPSSIPEQIFARSTHVVPSANIGVGLKMNKVIPKLSAVECGYRFFLSGQTRFNDYNSEPTEGTLNTGKNYVNAVMCSIVF